MGGGTYFPSEGSPSPIANPPSLAGQTSFGNIANPVAPTTAWNQGAMVDAGRGKETLLPQQLAKTNGGGMTDLETTAKPQTPLDKVGEYLQRTGLGSALNAAGAAGFSKLFNVN
jgi:hypothetical protein